MLSSSFIKKKINVYVYMNSQVQEKGKWDISETFRWKSNLNALHFSVEVIDGNENITSLRKFLFYSLIQIIKSHLRNVI